MYKCVLFSMIFLIGTASSALYASDCVVLLHGLARTGFSMNKIERSLKKEDYIVVNQSYPSRSDSIFVLADEAIPSAVQSCGSYEQVHFVTHSMGGILVRAYLSDNEIKNLGRVVMLAPPNQGNELAAYFSEWKIGQYVGGEALSELANTEEGIQKILGSVNFELGVIAGDRSISPIFSRILNGEDDGKVRVDSTRVEGMKEHIVVHSSHTFITVNKQVIREIKRFLKHGSFAPQRDDLN